MTSVTADCIPLLPIEELARRRRRQESSVGDIWELLDSVMDPEIPVISLYELGVLQDIRRDGDAVKLVLAALVSPVGWALYYAKPR